MELAELNLSEKAERGLPVVIKHPITDEDTDIVITVKGADSATYRNKLADIVRNSKKLGDAEGADLLAAITVSIEGAEENGKPISDYAEFYTKYHWAANQINVAIGNREAFFALPAKS